MCGRFSIYLDELELRERFPNHDISSLKDLKVSNFAPTMEMPIICLLYTSDAADE